MKLTKRQLNKLKIIFQRHHVELAYLFGSQVSGKTTKLSDIDIAVLFNKKIKKDQHFNKILTMEAETAKILSTNYVDMVSLHDASPLLAHQAVRGQPLYIKDRNKHLELCLNTLHDYEDTRHFRATAYQALAKRLKNGTFARPLIDR